MPSELWSVEYWPAPTPETVVRTRVRRRARGLMRWRVVRTAGVLALSLAAAMGQMPSMGASSRVRVADEATEQVVPVETTIAPTPTTAPVRAARVAAPRSAPRQVETTVPAPAPADVAPAEVRHDETGDAKYAAVCSGCPEPSEARSQPALDVTSVGVQCRASTVRVVLNLLDLDAPLQPNQVGLKPVDSTFHVTLDFGPDNPGSMFFYLIRSERSGVVQVGALVSVREGKDNHSADYVPSVWQEGDAFVFEVSREQLRDLYNKAKPGSAPAPGAAYRISSYSFAGFEAGVNAYVQTADMVWPPDRFPHRFCG